MENIEILELIKKAKAGDNGATETLIEKYLNAVRKINNKWGGTDDGFQEGILGIYQAIKNYDEKFNIKFLTYLYYNVESKIRKFIDKERYRVPQHVIEGIKKGERERLQFSEIENFQIEDNSVDLKASEGKVFIENIISCCNKREKEVLKLLFIEGYNGEEVARKLGITRQYIYNIKNKAFKKIRRKIREV